ncbi:hypothetical protein Kfla_6575 [Kribbella flavida DSM 17836]|uniref:Uncharacterized protein n=1 Tax=Kribbella flavida (strain DSM 17836 / JCM 10339 / NBRC 14399) TaxID=479435 RepID=D2PZK4_KRIFD|nr:hypothetical protein [Kribbella flavida]ADB35570.1 hypothetical protein Kfla_6575 [Kribbella flavida DSM 17836]
MQKVPALLAASTVLAAAAVGPFAAAAARPASTTAAAAAVVPAGAYGAPDTRAVQTAGTADVEPPAFPATPVRTYPAFDANQAVAVDAKYFYAVNNRTVTKHDRSTGEPLLQFAGDTDGPVEHLDSGVVVNGKLYAAHSNYPEWPMESSIEVFDTRTMRHVSTHSFGIERGSLTWLDRYDGAWWAGFANYDKPREGSSEPYGQTYNTQVVKLNDRFEVVAGWTIPKPILDRFSPMSNSGGSWGPDGRLYLTGHDLGEAYVMTLPVAGSELRWVATVHLPEIQGQGIAWDRSSVRNPTFWAISRPARQVRSFTLPVRSIADPAAKGWQVLGPGQFRR